MRLLCLSLTALLSIALLSSAVIGAEEKKAAAIGEAAPAFSLQDQDGKTVTLAEQKGKIVVLEWFNEDCPVVVRVYTSKIVPDTAKKWSEKGVVWLSVNSTKGKTNATNKAAATAWKMDRPILNDASGDVGHAYGATNTPHMYVIDGAGKLVYMGAIDNDENGTKSADKINYVDKALTELTAATALTTPQTKAYGCSVKYAK